MIEGFITGLGAIGFLIRKELLALFKEPSSRVILLVPALLQSLLFGYGATYDLTNAPYAVLDLSHGAAAASVMQKLDGTGVFRRQAMLVSTTQIASAIENDDMLMVLVFPADFENRLGAGQSAPLLMVLDGRNSSTAGAAAAQVGAIVASINAGRAGAPAISIERRAWYNPNLESRWNMMPGLIAALSVAREREQGTFDQLLVTPFTPMQLLIGKAIPSILVGLAQSTIIFLIIVFWFRIPFAGSVALLYLGLVTFTIAAVGIGLSISALSVSMQQAMLYTFLLIMPLMLLSGMLTPVSNMPEFLQIATLVNPLRFGMDLTRRVYLEGAGLHEVAHDFVPMLAVAAVTLPLAAWLFRNRLA